MVYQVSMMVRRTVLEQDRNKEMEKNGISIITQGFITGVPGGILAECLMHKIQGSVLLAKAEKAKPDPIASASALRVSKQAIRDKRRY